MPKRLRTTSLDTAAERARIAAAGGLEEAQIHSAQQTIPGTSEELTDVQAAAWIDVRTEDGKWVSLLHQWRFNGKSDKKEIKERLN